MITNVEDEAMIVSEKTMDALVPELSWTVAVKEVVEEEAWECGTRPKASR